MYIPASSDEVSANCTTCSPGSGENTGRFECPVRAGIESDLAAVAHMATLSEKERNLALMRAAGIAAARNEPLTWVTVDIQHSRDVLADLANGACDGPITERIWSVNLPIWGIVRFGPKVVRCQNDAVSQDWRQGRTLIP